MINTKVLNPKILFIPFCMQHGIGKDAASSRLRCYWVSKYLEGSEVWDGSQNAFGYDVVILQKYYMFPKQLKLASELTGKKKLVIFDLCDGEWTYPGRDRPLREMMQVVDFCTTSTEYIKRQIEDRYNHTCYLIPDRQDLDFHSNIKIHEETKHPVICWYGNRRTLATLSILKPVLSRLGRELDLTLRVILEAGQKFECPNVKVEMVEWKLETINKEILKSDLIINPHLDNELELAKSNNKTTKGWALGMPVVDWTSKNWYDDIKKFLMNHKIRAYEGWNRRREVEKKWDVKISAREWREILNENLR